jgi:hypothetical protein
MHMPLKRYPKETAAKLEKFDPKKFGPQEIPNR